MKTAYVQIGLIGIFFLVLFHQTLVELVMDWSNNPNFSHGFLIPFIAGYLIWHKRDQLSRDDIHSRNFGFVITVTGLALHVIGNIGAEFFTMRFAVVVTVLGLATYCFGYKLTWCLLFPILYLIFMVPIPAIIWNKLSFPLQLFAARLASITINLAGIPVFREGNILHLSSTSLEVVDACSGLRSLTTLLALSAAFSYCVSLNRYNKLLLFFSAIPIAIIINVFRLLLTASLSTYYGAEIAQGFLHDISGILVFIVAIILLYITYWFLLKIENRFFVDESEVKLQG